MLPKTLEEPWQNLQERTDRILERVAALDDTRQRTAPNARVWSPLQIVDHLIRAEGEYLHFVEVGERQGVSTRRPSRSPMIPLLAWIMRKRLSFPTIPTMVPSDEPRPLSELTPEWRQVRATFRERVGGLTEATKDTPLALNPLLGPLTAAQMLSLMEAHLDYHLAQIPPM